MIGPRADSASAPSADRPIGADTSVRDAKRILFLSDVYFPRVNGVSTSIQTFRAELAALGHESVLVAPNYPGRQDCDANTVRVASRYVPLDPEDRAMRWGGLQETLSKLRHEPFDLVHVQTPFLAHYAGVRFARERGLPCVATYHTLFEEYLHHYLPLLPAGVTRALARRFSRSQCNELDAVIAPSTVMRETLLAYGVTRPIAIIPTGIGPSEFARGDGARFRVRHGIAQDRPVLLFVGRVAHEKNIEFLLGVHARVKAACPGVLLVICGEGPALRALKHRSAALGLGGDVRFVGYLDRTSELPDCYRAADLFVFASKTETQGLVLLEAMAAGTPAVALAAMGTRDVLRNGAGARIAPDSEQGFAEQVLALLADPQARRALAATCAPYAAEWEAREMAKRLERSYQEICTTARRRPRLRRDRFHR